MQFLISNVYTGKPRTVLMMSTSHLRVREIACGFGGPSEKNVSPH